MTDEQPIVEMSFNEFVEGIEEAEIVKRVNESHKKDYDGSRRKYADSVSRSEVLRNRAKAGLAERNGHGGLSGKSISDIALDE